MSFKRDGAKIRDGGKSERVSFVRDGGKSKLYKRDEAKSEGKAPPSHMITTLD